METDKKELIHRFSLQLSQGLNNPGPSFAPNTCHKINDVGIKTERRRTARTLAEHPLRDLVAKMATECLSPTVCFPPYMIIDTSESVEKGCNGLAQWPRIPKD